jgi:hypothetical protein
MRVRSGDADAFSVVFDVYAKSVYNHAFRLTGDWSVAEDVMAATFLEAWRARQRIAEDGGSLCCGCRKPMPLGDTHGSRLRRGRAAGRGCGLGR